MGQSQKDERINNEILAAAREIFSRYGLKKSTMEDVAKAIGKGKSTLYYYYPGKNELFEAVVRDEVDRLVRSIREAVNKVSSSREKLKALLSERLALKKRMQNLSRVIQEDIFDNMETICGIRQEFEKTQVAFVKEILLGGIQLGEFRKLSNDEITFLSYWIVASFSSLSLPIYSAECLRETDQFCDKVVDFIIDGVRR